MPPSARFSAQIRPPCASTSPRAIASPSPAPACSARPRRIAAPEALEHAGALLREPAPRRCPRPRRAPLEALGLQANRDRAVGGRVAKRVREQVVEHALDLLRRAAAPSRRRSAAPPACTCFASASAWSAADAGLDERRDRLLPAARASSAPASIRASSNRSSTRLAESAHLFLHGRQVVGRARRFRPRPPRASPAETRWACAGRGLPRRRARGARRRAARGSPAISLKERASSASSAGPLSGARALQVAAGESGRRIAAGGRRRRAIGRATSSAADHGGRGRGGRDGRGSSRRRPCGT